MSFDIVIAVGPSDQGIIRKQLEYTLKNIVGYRSVYTICSDSMLQFDGCVSVPESSFPFSLETVRSFHGDSPRNGWYLQQLLKLYAGIVIPGILTRYLVIDGDTIFMRPTSFVEDDLCLYNHGWEYHTPYFDHMRRLDPCFARVDAHKSGICHHMMFEVEYVGEMIARVENAHNDAFYNVFLRHVSEHDRNLSGASEYEMYFNYMLQYHPDKIRIRPLRWDNCGTFDPDSDLDYVSVHHYMR